MCKEEREIFERRDEYEYEHDARACGAGNECLVCAGSIRCTLTKRRHVTTEGGRGPNFFFLDCGRESLVVEIDLDMARYDVVLVKGQAT